MHLQLQNSPTLALLHKRHASVLLSFFYRIFREGAVAEVPEARLEGIWQTFIEEEVVDSDWEGEPPTNSAKKYLEEWCRNRWLARNYDEQEGAYLYRLTAHTEQALLFVEQHLENHRRAFIGTESNFSKIWQALTELAEKTQTERPERVRSGILTSDNTAPWQYRFTTHRTARPRACHGCQDSILTPSSDTNYAEAVDS